jgi:hypothetical protein
MTSKLYALCKTTEGTIRVFVSYFVNTVLTLDGIINLYD